MEDDVEVNDLRGLVYESLEVKDEWVINFMDGVVGVFDIFVS